MMTRHQAREYRKKIEHAAQTQTDSDALESIELFPIWEAGLEITKVEGIWYIDGIAIGGDLRMRHEGHLYRVIQPHTTQSDWAPSIDTASLYSLVAPATEGTRENPVVFEIGMVLEEGKYYREGEKLYYCYNGTGANPTTFSLIYYGAFVHEVV